jgi:Tol biopolymer transport system component/tRNA A-37 threonylcarbamoyl transferase component Bud32
MTISPESKLGPYEVLSLLGAGGMGEVYRARDPRLNREVAIKVLPAGRMADEGRRRRFIQEARAASALNHPNIITIYEIDAVDGIDFIVMEYVPGKSLDALIPPHGMRLGDVLRIAIPVADALAQAHARGIVHRDLKPANVAVSNEGVVKVLDFGLAKLVAKEEPSDEQRTVTKNATASELSRAGAIAGTAGYMSPEQATGGKIDSRSDVFSFGAVLYEMVTGRRAFAANSTADTLAAVVRDQPKAPSALVLDVPRDLEKLILRCLRKEVDRRFQHMLDVKLELEQIKEESASRLAAAVPGRRRRLAWIGAGLALALVLATAIGLRRRSPAVIFDPPRLAPPVTSMRGDEDVATLSPDGNQVAFTWNGEKLDNVDIYLKTIGSPEVRRLTTNPGPDVTPSWSPDGKQIAFVRAGPDGLRIHLLSTVDGSDRKLSDFPHAGGPPSWSPDGRWLAAARATKGTGPVPGLPGSDGLYLVPVNGGEPRPLRIPQEARDTFNPRFAPDGSHLAYLSGVNFSQHVAVVDLGPGYVPTGAPRRLTRRPVWPLGGLAWSRDGKSLLYVEWGIHRLWRVDITGNRPPEVVEVAGLGVKQPATVASRDRLVFVKELYDADVYRFEVGRPAEPVLTSTFPDYNPQLSPNGKRVAFESDRSGEHLIWLAEADGSRPRQLTQTAGVWQGSPRWSPDSLRLAFDFKADDGRWDIWTIDADGASPRRLTQDRGDENMPSWSRDGRFIYFASDRQGLPTDIWRVPAAGGTEERITQGGGGLAYESIDGKTLFFMRRILEDSPLLALPLAGGPERQIVKCVSTFAVGPEGLYGLECRGWPQASLFVQDPATGQGRLLGKVERSDTNGLTVSPDGKTILYTKVVGEGSDLMMIENFR